MNLGLRLSLCLVGVFDHSAVLLVAKELGRMDKDKTRHLHTVCAVIEINGKKGNESVISFIMTRIVTENSENRLLILRT